MNKPFRYIFIAVLILLWSMIMIPWVFAKDRTFHGKVIDVDTKEPIEGAVVVAYWLEARATVSGEDTRLKEVKETLTDKDGKWSITGPKGKEGSNALLIFTFLTGTYYTREPRFIIFKPGYCSWPQGFSIDACKEKIIHSGTGEITEGGNVELPKLINRDRMTVIRNIPSLGMASEAEAKLPSFKKLIEQEERKIQR
jgi:hypothetical protein